MLNIKKICKLKVIIHRDTKHDYNTLDTKFMLEKSPGEERLQKTVATLFSINNALIQVLMELILCPENQKCHSFVLLLLLCSLISSRSHLHY